MNLKKKKKMIIIIMMMWTEIQFKNSKSFWVLSAKLLVAT